MQRREFLQSGLLLGTAGLLPGVELAANGQLKESAPVDMDALIDKVVDEDIIVFDELDEKWQPNEYERDYIRRIAEIPKLTRQEEFTLSKQIRGNSRKFRAKVLGCDYFLQYAVQTLKLGHYRALPDLEPEFLSPAEPEISLNSLFPKQLRTLERIIRRNRQDYRCATRKSYSPEERKAAWSRLGRRRRRAVRIIDEIGFSVHSHPVTGCQEMPLSTCWVETMIPTLEAFSNRADELQCQIREHKLAGSPKDERRLLEEEFKSILQLTQETPTSLRNRVKAAKELTTKYLETKKELVAGNLWLVISIAKNYRNRGLTLLDLIQEGRAGLMWAGDKFVYRRGFNFRTYAKWWIRHAISRALSYRGYHSCFRRISIHEVESIMAKIREARFCSTSQELLDYADYLD